MTGSARPPDDEVTACALIGVDWGTTSLRLYAMDAAGNVVRHHESSEGILSIGDGGFGPHLERTLASWVDHASPPPIVLSGMITSRQGWVETPYLTCPAPVTALAAALQAARSPSGWPLYFISGLSCRRADGTPDVMRGEETQTLGAGLADGLLVMPGTHSKWIHLRDGAVREFTTYMTGEVFASLRDHTLLGRLMTAGGDDPAAFARGVSTGLDAAGGLLGRLFGVRSHGLFNDIPGDGLCDYLSGLLIGTEFKEALAAAGGGAATLTLLGRGDLMDRYARAAAIAGTQAVTGPAHTAARGQYLVAREAGLLRG